jgi:hypothetical protein
MDCCNILRRGANTLNKWTLLREALEPPPLVNTQDTLSVHVCIDHTCTRRVDQTTNTDVTRWATRTRQDVTFTVCLESSVCVREKTDTHTQGCTKPASHARTIIWYRRRTMDTNYRKHSHNIHTCFDDRCCCSGFARATTAHGRTTPARATPQSDL